MTVPVRAPFEELVLKVDALLPKTQELIEESGLGS